jgi:hypothetical protein
VSSLAVVGSFVDLDGEGLWGQGLEKENRWNSRAWSLSVFCLRVPVRCGFHIVRALAGKYRGV